MRFLAALGFSVLLFAMGCGKSEFPDGTPMCIKERILNHAGVMEKVEEFKFDGLPVYRIEYTCPDCGVVLYNGLCEVIGTTYGFSGGPTGEYARFEQEGIYVRLIW